MRTRSGKPFPPLQRTGAGSLLHHTSRDEARKETQVDIHTNPCNCGDDAQRHWALVARDLMAQGCDTELTDDMRQAYELEFCTAPASEPDPF